MLPVPTHATVPAGAWPSAGRKKKRGRARCVLDWSSINSLVENLLHIPTAAGYPPGGCHSSPFVPIHPLGISPCVPIFRADRVGTGGLARSTSPITPTYVG